MWAHVYIRYTFPITDQISSNGDPAANLQKPESSNIPESEQTEKGVRQIKSTGDMDGINMEVGLEDQRKGVVVKMDINIGDILKLKKQHPCGSKEWEVLRVGADFRIRCRGCGHQIMIARRLLEKNIKEICQAEA